MTRVRLIGPNLFRHSRPSTIYMEDVKITENAALMGNSIWAIASPKHSVKYRHLTIRFMT